MTTHFDAPLLRRDTIAEHTVEVIFGVPDFAWGFTAGQYVTITTHGLEHLDVRSQFRDFSIASSPLQKGEFSVAFRVSQSPFKHVLLSCPIGAVFSIDGPKGVFTQPDEPDQPLNFIAGGIGITPFLSMLRFGTGMALSRRITLYYFNHSMESAAYLPELTQCAQTMPSFTLYHTVGHMTDAAIIQAVQESSANARWYIAGPPAMVAHAQMVLRTQNISDRLITSESFTGYTV